MYPVKIINIHKEGTEHANIVVTHFPLTDNGKINWWLDHKEFIKKTYNTPAQSRYYIAIWDIGDGYVADSYKEDFYCFSDMKTTKNCIEKNLLMIIDNTLPNDNDDVLFFINGDLYRQDKNGNITHESIEPSNIINQNNIYNETPPVELMYKTLTSDLNEHFQSQDVAELA